MDEIQSCIADAHYSEAIRPDQGARPTEKMPVPPEEFDRVHRGDWDKKVANLTIRVKWRDWPRRLASTR